MVGGTVFAGERTEEVDEELELSELARLRFLDRGSEAPRFESTLNGAKGLGRSEPVMESMEFAIVNL